MIPHFQNTSNQQTHHQAKQLLLIKDWLDVTGESDHSGYQWRNVKSPHKNDINYVNPAQQKAMHQSSWTQLLIIPLASTSSTYHHTRVRLKVMTGLCLGILPLILWHHNFWFFSCIFNEWVGLNNAYTTSSKSIYPRIRLKVLTGK